MVDSNALQQCLDTAYRYLSYRPRSEAEMEQRLHQRGFDTEVTQQAIARLKELDLIDDYAFAQFWKDNRLLFKPKSKRLIARELAEKKVSREIVEQVTKDIDDMDSACKLGRRRMSILARLAYPGFYRRLSNYLTYRGFSYMVIKHTVALLWQEREDS